MTGWADTYLNIQQHQLVRNSVLSLVKQKGFLSSFSACFQSFKKILQGISQFDPSTSGKSSHFYQLLLLNTWEKEKTFYKHPFGH